MRRVILGLLSLCMASAASAERIATIIANSDYEHTGWDLPNPVRDGDLMKTALEAADFDVVLIKNADEDDLEEAFVRHGQRLQSAGQEAVGFFYFAGHGIQSGRYNYLVPVDMVAKTEQDVWAQAPRLGLLFDAIEYAGNDTNFIVLDACRDNPLPSATRGGPRGLQARGHSRGTLIAYSTTPGNVAADGDGEYSPFAAALARFLPEPGVTAETLFRRVASAVELQTDMAQQPWVESGLRGADFCFGGCGDDTRASEESEMAALLAAFESSEPSALKAFINAFPRSTSRGLVEARLVELTGDSSAADIEGLEPQKPQVSSFDARLTPASTPAPVIDIDPSTLPDFALFRECETCPDMVVLPAGSYRMGSPKGEPGRNKNEGPQIDITLPRLAVSRFETTKAQFVGFVETTGADLGNGCYSVSKSGRWKKYKEANVYKPNLALGDHKDANNEYSPDAPAMCISWNDSISFAQYVSGQTPGAYRLPSEAEWEYAARGGTTTAYSYGEDGSKGCRYMNGADLGLKREANDVKTTFCDDGFGGTSPVGSHTPNPFGLHDMHGNVAEYVADCETNDLSSQVPDGSVKVTPRCSKRVVRGGAWANEPAGLRSATRTAGSPSHGSIFTGFRLVRSLN